MAQLFQVFRGNTQEELTKVKANTREGMLLKALGSNKGRLEDSNGAVVTEDSTDPVLGDYRFFADAAGRQLPQMICSGALLHLSASPQLRAGGCLLLGQPLEVNMCAKAVGVLDMFVQGLQQQAKGERAWHVATGSMPAARRCSGSLLDGCTGHLFHVQSQSAREQAKP